MLPSSTDAASRQLHKYALCAPSINIAHLFDKGEGQGRGKVIYQKHKLNYNLHL